MHSTMGGFGKSTFMNIVFCYDDDIMNKKFNIPFFKITPNWTVSFESEEIYIYGFGRQSIMQGFPQVLDHVTNIKQLICSF